MAQEARAEVVRVRGERLEDAGRRDREASDAAAAMKRQVEALDADKAQLAVKVEELRATIGKLDEVRSCMGIGSPLGECPGRIVGDVDRYQRSSMSNADGIVDVDSCNIYCQ